MSGDALTSGACNIAMGLNALGAATTGYCNVAIGPSAMSTGVVEGNDNVAIGRDAMPAITTGVGNIAIGGNVVGSGVLTGHYNVVMGLSAGVTMTSATRNTLIGNDAGGAITSGHCNTFLGYATGITSTTGISNTGVGHRALCSSSGTSDYNTAVGYYAGGGITSGDQNILIGVQAGCNPEVNVTTHNNYMALGDNNTSQFSVTVALTVVSDARDKTDISDLDLGLDYIKALRPVYYRWDKRGWYDDSATPHGTEEELNTYLNYEPDGTKKRNRWEIGLLAQEVLAAEKLHTSNTQTLNEGLDLVANEGVTVDGTNETGYQLQYQKITMPLIKASQELDDKIVALTARVTTLEG